MTEFFTVVDVTPGAVRAPIRLRSSWRDARVHSLVSEAAAKSRKTLLANQFPKREFAVLQTLITEDGQVISEWITPVTFEVKAA